MGMVDCSHNTKLQNAGSSHVKLKIKLKLPTLPTWPLFYLFKTLMRSLTHDIIDAIRPKQKKRRYLSLTFYCSFGTFCAFRFYFPSSSSIKTSTRRVKKINISFRFINEVAFYRSINPRYVNLCMYIHSYTYISTVSRLSLHYSTVVSYFSFLHRFYIRKSRVNSYSR